MAKKYSPLSTANKIQQNLKNRNHAQIIILTFRCDDRNTKQCCQPFEQQLAFERHRNVHHEHQAFIVYIEHFRNLIWTPGAKEAFRQGKRTLSPESTMKRIPKP